jgi:hypothetical protein
MKKIKIIPTSEESSFIVNIEKASVHIPDWYKSSKQKIKGLEKFFLIPDVPQTTTSTYKKCSPFLDALTNGYIFYLTQDIEVLIKDDGSPYIIWRPANMPGLVTFHHNDQWSGLEWPKDCHEFVYKWENNFIIKTPKRYSILFTHPHNRFDLPFYTLSGVVDTDRYNLPVVFPFFLKKDFVGVIKAGTPLAQITFIKRESWFRNIKKFKKIFVRKEYFKYMSKIERSYKNLIWQRKDYE